MLKKSLGALMLVSAVISCQRGLSPARHAHAMQTVKGRVAEWARAINNRAPDSLALLYYQGPELVVVTTEGQVVHGWAAESARQKEWALSGGGVNLVVDDLSADVIGVEAAVTTFGTTLDEERQGVRVITRGRVTQIWARERDGAPWKIRAEHHSSATRN